MWRCPPASGTPFITRPRAKKKPRGPTEESRPKQNLLVHPRPPPHRQVNAILPAASSTLERASELIDAKHRQRPELRRDFRIHRNWRKIQLLEFLDKIFFRQIPNLARLSQVEIQSCGSGDFGIVPAALQHHVGR